jgi:hypothetical protein
MECTNNIIVFHLYFFIAFAELIVSVINVIILDVKLKLIVSYPYDIGKSTKFDVSIYRANH